MSAACEGSTEQHFFPVQEAWHLLKKQSSYVSICENTLILRNAGGQETIREVKAADRVDILEDSKSVEVFVNGGAQSFTYWLI